ncbi:DUF177 domain-containing protein [Methylopila sp. M107]|uniref:YceD family protein n=1 Tax=Methylopila sp. M107 TaxID=1101190 RepID=UPI00037E1FB1|nr:DUF177 domain-containing protein [Methylopila sp. M107]
MSDAVLSRPLIVATVPPAGVSIEVVADKAERAALAAENDVLSIERLVARLEVRPVGRGSLSVTGALEALATRQCVVTLEPFVEAVAEEVDVRFAPEDGGDEPSGDDAPEDRIAGGMVDLGSVAAEFFVLGLDPYPRKPGATFDAAAGAADESGSPFAALRGLKPRSGEPD